MLDGSMPENLGRVAAAAWVVEGGVAVPVPVNHEWERMYATDPSDTFYLRPSYLFYRDGGEVLLSERYGPRMTHRSCGRVSSAGGAWQMEWTTRWHTGPEQRQAEPGAAPDPAT